MELKEKQEYKELEIVIKRKGHEEEKYIVEDTAYMKRLEKDRYKKKLKK